MINLIYLIKTSYTRYNCSHSTVVVIGAVRLKPNIIKRRKFAFGFLGFSVSNLLTRNKFMSSASFGAHDKANPVLTVDSSVNSQ